MVHAPKPVTSSCLKLYLGSFVPLWGPTGYTMGHLPTYLKLDAALDSCAEVLRAELEGQSLRHVKADDVAIK